MSNFPVRAQRIDPIARQARKLIDDAERAAATHPGDLTAYARRILARGKQRDRYFDPMLFSNPAWDILLNLYVAGGEGRMVSVLDTCVASTVPQGVALRWLAFLKQEEMVVEMPDPARPRQTLIRLSDHARLTMSSYLGSLVSRKTRPGEPTDDFLRC